MHANSYIQVKHDLITWPLLVSQGAAARRLQLGKLATSSWMSGINLVIYLSARQWVSIFDNILNCSFNGYESLRNWILDRNRTEDIAITVYGMHPHHYAIRGLKRNVFLSFTQHTKQPGSSM